MKRTFDLVVSVTALAASFWLILLLFVIATIDTRKNGFLLQTRIGRHGRPFKLIKLRTMRNRPDCQTTVTSAGDPRITKVGRILRQAKLDELPQLFNVVLGHMSLIGPRPDVPGFADKLEGDDRIILSVRPGISGPASLKFRDEEALLARQCDPEKYNREVIYPEKVRLNREYIENYSFSSDLKLVFETIFRRPSSREGR
jgi:lipopolysaccharide/colanic/teichoic acid biosynthesis glycosyltransferase